MHCGSSTKRVSGIATPVAARVAFGRFDRVDNSTTRCYVPDAVEFPILQPGKQLKVFDQFAHGRAFAPNRLRSAANQAPSEIGPGC